MWHQKSRGFVDTFGSSGHVGFLNKLVLISLKEFAVLAASQVNLAAILKAKQTIKAKLSFFHILSSGSLPGGAIIFDVNPSMSVND